MRRILMVSVLCLACAEPSEDALARADEALEVGDMRAFAGAIEEALGDAVTRDEATARLERAWREREGRLDTGAALPDGVRRVAVDVIRRREPDGVAHRIVVRAEADPGVVRALRVEDVDGALTRDGEELELESGELDALPEGLVHVVLETATGVARYWVPIAPLTCAETPSVEVPPHVGARPDVRWDDFRSPDLAPFERRSLGVWLARREPDGLRPVTASFHDGAELPTRLDLGEDLEPGRHWLAVTYGEGRELGPLTVRRACRALVPLDVAAP